MADENEIKRLIRDLGRKDEIAAWNLRCLAEDGKDISAAIPKLKSFEKQDPLDGDDVEIRRHAAEAITLYYAHRKMWKEIKDLVASKDKYFRGSTFTALSDAAMFFFLI